MAKLMEIMRDYLGDYEFYKINDETTINLAVWQVRTN